MMMKYVQNNFFTSQSESRKTNLSNIGNYDYGKGSNDHQHIGGGYKPGYSLDTSCLSHQEENRREHFGKLGITVRIK